MKLLEKIKVGNLEFKNRIMFPPLTTGYEERDGSIGDRSFNFYKRLAQGGTAYIVIGDVAPVMTASPTPKLFDDRQIPTFKKLADALHEYDCKLGLQLFHPEYDVAGVGKLIMVSRNAMMKAQEAKANNDMTAFAELMAESKKYSDSAYAKLHHDMNHFVNEASVEQLEAIKKSIAQSANRAMRADVDAIEVHGDRLIGSLCSKLLNKRTDNYGGSLENRVRYALEVVKAIKEAAPTLMIEYKLPIITKNADGTDRGKGGLYLEESIEFAKMLEKAGVDMIQVAQANHTGNMGDTIPPMGTVPYNWTLPACREIKKVVNICVATVGRVVSVENAEKILDDNDADMIGFGRSLLADEDIAHKVAKKEPIRECLNCNKGCVDAIQGRKYISCVLNAENGNEGTIFIKEAKEKKNVVIVGGGIAGLEAARVAAIRGHKVDLYEKEARLGGQINIAAVPPRKKEILRSIKYYLNILPILGVNIHLNQEATKDIMNQADEVIIAIGASDLKFNIEGVNQEHVLSSWDVLDAKVTPRGKCAVIGGGLVGVETAEHLLSLGNEVMIIEMTDKIANGESQTILPLIEADFKKHNVLQFINSKLVKINEDSIELLNLNTNETTTVSCDTVVLAVGSVKNKIDLEGVTTHITFVGDCSGDKTASISEAIRSAYHAANEI